MERELLSLGERGVSHMNKLQSTAVCLVMINDLIPDAENWDFFHRGNATPCKCYRWKLQKMTVNPPDVLESCTYLLLLAGKIWPVFYLGTKHTKKLIEYCCLPHTVANLLSIHSHTITFVWFTNHLPYNIPLIKINKKSRFPHYISYREDKGQVC